jgi:orotidine-5'-phosphate decarboxylase
MKKICIAVDKSDQDFNLHQFVDQFPINTMFKIGLEYFTKFGLQSIAQLGCEIFLDLKFFDIPNTVYHAVYNVCSIPNVCFITIHASGGLEMVKSAVQARNKSNSNAKIICVTKLTSQSANIDEVLDLTKTSLNAGADGVVCSALEVRQIRKQFGLKPIIITPGIRPQWYNVKDDQVRVCTPKEAFENGSNVLIIGRPITVSDNPCNALQKIIDEL